MDPIEYEEISLLAWPPAQLVHVDGWALGYTNGYTRRANSVYPLGASARPLADAVDACEAFYRSHNLPATFKLTNDPAHAALDKFLAARAYTQDGFTRVMSLPLEGKSAMPFFAGKQNDDVSLVATAEPWWIDGAMAMGAVSSANRQNLMAILGAIKPPHRFVAMRKAGEVVALGLGVLSRGQIGLFDIFTHQDHRKQGLATKVIAGLIDWGIDNGAEAAWLQVVEENHPALALYAKLGFTGNYRYWYRAKG